MSRNHLIKWAAVAMMAASAIPVLAISHRSRVAKPSAAAQPTTVAKTIAAEKSTSAPIVKKSHHHHRHHKHHKHLPKSHKGI